MEQTLFGTAEIARELVTETDGTTDTVAPSTAESNDDEIIAIPTITDITDISPFEFTPDFITLDERANRIRSMQADVQRGIIEIGNELLAAKKEVGHGNWSAWLKEEFSWSDRTARRFMAVAERPANTQGDSRFSFGTGAGIWQSCFAH